MSLADLLAQGDIAEFNSTRSQRSRVDLFAADLSGKTLTGADLSSANLQKADLSGSDLTDCNLMKADLSGVDGAGLKLDGAMGMKIRLREAWLEGADLTGVDFTRGDLSESTLTASKSTNGRYSRARLKKATAQNLDWQEVDLSEASLYQTDFTGSDLRRSDLTSCSATEVNLQNCKLDSIIGTSGNFTDAQMQGASFVGARLDGANLAGADLSGANLEAVDLSRANLTGANLSGAKLTGACLADACLDGVDLTGLAFDQVDMTGLDPVALGLSEAQIDGLANYGSVFDPDAPLIVEQPVAARNGKAVGFVWTNQDSEDVRTVRWAIIRDGASPISGVLPFSEETVMATAMLSDPDGFRLMVLQQRPGGVALVQTPLSVDGKTGTARVDSLKYTPAVNPIYRWVNGHLLIVGMAHRGPTVILQLVTAEELKVFVSSKVATGRGFISRHDPVLACKGDVVMSIGSKGPGEPVRTPSGFPGNKGVVAPHQGKLVAIWHVEIPNDEPDGAIQLATLGGRQGVDVEMIHRVPKILSLDAVGNQDGIWIAWVQPGSRPLSTEAYRMCWPDGDVERLDVGGALPRTIRFALDVEMKTSVPGLIITTLDDEAVAVGSDGTALGRMGG